MNQDQQLREAAEKAITTLDDWLNTYASDHCDPSRVAEANRRIYECGGTIAYITEATLALRSALLQASAQREQPAISVRSEIFSPLFREWYATTDGNPTFQECFAAGLSAQREQPAEHGFVRVPLGDAARDVLAERRRQIEVEGWTPEHDDTHGFGHMAYAASSYARHAGFSLETGKWMVSQPQEWPWSHHWWKPSDPRRNLVKAAALILAEIERLDRAAIAQGQRALESNCKCGTGTYCPSHDMP